MYKNCNSTGETTDCTLSCREGYFPPQNTSQSTSWSTTYRCGPFTGYEWTPPVEDIECSSMYYTHFIRRFLSIGNDIFINIDKHFHTQ